jgi:hypothetical protein
VTKWPELSHPYLVHCQFSSRQLSLVISHYSPLTRTLSQFLQYTVAQRFSRLRSLQNIPRTQKKEKLSNHSFFVLHTRSPVHHRHSLLIRNICAIVPLTSDQSRYIYDFDSSSLQLESLCYRLISPSKISRSVHERLRDFLPVSRNLCNHGFNSRRQNDQVAPGAKRR